MRRSPLAAAAIALAVLTAGACGDDDGPSGEDGLGDLSDETSGRGWTEEDLQRLATVEVEGFTGSTVNETPGIVVRYFESDDPSPEGVSINAQVRFSSCDPFICWDLDAPLDATRLESLRSNLPARHLENPDLVFETSNPEIAPGYEAFATYRRSFVDYDGGTVSANGYTVLYHDSANHITVEIFARGGPSATSDADLLAEMTENDARTVAASVFAAFADELEPVS